MPRIKRRLLRLATRLLHKTFMGPPFPLGFQRRWARVLGRTATIPDGIDVKDMATGDVPIERVSDAAGTEAEAADRPAILFLHGGAFVRGRTGNHRAFAAHLSRATGADVYVPDYRLAPEHPCPAATDDAFVAYRSVLERGHDPRRVAIAGDSAGGALAIETALAIGEMGTPSPAAMVLVSPVTDLGLSGASVRSKARAEAVLRRSGLEDAYRAYAGGIPRSDPRVSPLYADVTSLPPTLIQVGEDEILLDDSRRFADRAWSQGVELELQRFPGLWHDFQFQAGEMREADEAIAAIGSFLTRQWRG